LTDRIRTGRTAYRVYLHLSSLLSIVCAISQDSPDLTMTTHAAKDPLHGLTLEALLIKLEARYGWEELAKRVNINCFKSDPSIKSSLKFLRRTPWARKEVEDLYIASLEDEVRGQAAPLADDPWASWQGKK